MKVVVGLGNPGLRYDDTRHNVGWWVVDRLAYDWGFGSFEKEGRSLRTGGSVGDTSVLLIKPTTFMNRSGAALVGAGVAVDFVPASGRNGQLDALDFVPLGLYVLGVGAAALGILPAL